MQRVTRRQVVAGVGAVGLGLAAGCGRWPGPAQEAARVYRIGYLVGPSGDGVSIERVERGLQELGYVEGHNFAIERRRSAHRDLSDSDALAGELVGLSVDLILAPTTPMALAAKRATNRIPIVFTSVSDPVGSGLVASLASPGGNVTGFSDFGVGLSAKRLELLRDAVPGTRLVGVVWSATNPANALLWRETEAAAPVLGVQVISLEVSDDDALDGGFEAAVREQVEAIIVVGSPGFGTRAAARAIQLRLPTLTEQASVVRADGLMAYAASGAATGRRTAYYVDRILKGAKAADLPVEQPREFDFIINLKTAHELGLTIPPARAAPGHRGHPVMRVTRRQVVQGMGAVGLGLVAGCGRWPGQAAPAPVPRIGVVLGGASAASPAADALRQGLREAGYVEGQNIWIEFREVEGRNEGLADAAAELVRLPVDVLVTAGPPAIRAAKGATDTIPIVMATSGAADPVAEGLVAGLARPGSNITGLSALAPQLNPKRLQLLTESVPGVARVAVLSGRGNLAAVSAELREAAAQLGLELDSIPVGEPREVADSLEAATRAGSSALLVVSSNPLLAQRRSVGELVARRRLPAMFDDKGYVDAGGLMSYGASATYSWRRAAYYVDRILKGANPADLPVEQPREFDFVINFKTAQALGLTIPPSVLLQATEVIQ